MTARKSVPQAARGLAATRHNKINLLWEYVQAFLAISLVSAMIFCSLRTSSVGREVVVPESLKAATFIVLGFYFGRTNHTRPVPDETGPGTVQSETLTHPGEH